MYHKFLALVLGIKKMCYTSSDLWAKIFCPNAKKDHYIYYGCCSSFLLCFCVKSIGIVLLFLIYCLKNKLKSI